MYEKVNPSHPDKVADRIAGAILDLATSKNPNTKTAVEVLIGHGKCTIISETDTILDEEAVFKAVERIYGVKQVDLTQVPQSVALAENQRENIKAGDNGIFKGVKTTDEEKKLSEIAHWIYEKYPSDGKYIIDENRVIVCQSNASTPVLKKELEERFPDYVFTVNPLGDWTGGTNEDTGATNRKLGSDMGNSVTGGGLHGKDLSKADVSVNIFAHILSNTYSDIHPNGVEYVCAIGDKSIGGCPYDKIVSVAKTYIEQCGGYEKFAEWGLI